jgi:Fic family protein
MQVVAPPPFEDIALGLDRKRLYELIRRERELDPDYLHWDNLRHREPPAGLTHEEWWCGIKLARASGLRPIPLTDTTGQPFSYSVPDSVFRQLHYVDQHCSGEIAMPEVVTTDEQARHHYLVNSLMEEAIRSSQLEGASTSRRVAKELLRSGRQPKDRSERMIRNNYLALQFMRTVDDKLTPNVIIELQRILTDGTLENADAAGRIQGPQDDRIAVYDNIDGTLVHTPPPAEQLPRRLMALCDFANEGDDSEPFIHPVVRGIIVHFWLAYDHPFEDGNGRTARALFYWYMRIRGYWLVEYLSISRILRDAPAQYGRAFLLTETDDRDVTYFLDYQLGVIERAVRELHKYLDRKVEELRRVKQLVQRSAAFNHRQLALLGYALRNPDEPFTFRTHAQSHDVTHETARTDLLALEEHGLLNRRTVRGRYVFRAADDLADRLQRVD